VRRGVPYQFLALKGLYGKPAVLDAAAYLAMVDDPHESSNVWRTLASSSYRVDAADLATLSHEAYRKGEPLIAAVRRHLTMTALLPETHAAIERLLADTAKHAALARDARPSELFIRHVYDCKVLERYQDDEIAENREALSHLNQFLSRIKRFEEQRESPTLRAFLAEYRVERDSGEEGGLPFDAETGPDMVRVMTVHAAKGLEFKHVYIIGLVDKRFPSVDRGSDPIELPPALAKETAPEGDGHLEEERRLMYVAMTRAKDALYLTSAEDYGGKLKKKPSRFLVELGLVEEQEKKKKAKGESADAPTGEFALPIVRPATAPLYSLPASFSFTQLAAYAKCPWQYKFAHVLKLPVLGKWSLSFGRTMHGTLEKFMAEVARRQAGEGQADLFGAADPVAGAARLPVSKDELFAMYEECWQDDWYPDLPTKDKYRREGKEMLSKLYDGMADNPPTPLYLEKDFTLKIGPYLLRGKIDRMDKLPDGTVEIIDYKTGTPKEELSADDKRQLLLYQLAAERSLGLQPTRLTYSYLENGANVSFLGTEKEIAKFEADVEAQIDRIRDADFAATPGKHCAYCDFRDICEFRKF
jgi:DNA helicase-2/ATP-dependent DNA helicase PcrA